MDKDQLRAPSQRMCYSKDFLISLAGRDCCRAWPDSIDPAVQRELGKIGSQDAPEWRKKPLLDRSKTDDEMVTAEATQVELKEQQIDKAPYLQVQATKISTYQDIPIRSSTETLEVSDRNIWPKNLQQQQANFMLQRDDSGGTSGITSSIPRTSSSTSQMLALFGQEARSTVPMPAAPTLQDIEKAITASPESSKLEKFLTCEDVEEYMVAGNNGVGGDDGAIAEVNTVPRTSEDSVLKAASEHILSLLHPKRDLGESKLLDELMSNSTLSPELSSLEGVLQGYEQSLAAADIGQGNSRPAANVQHDTVDSLRTSVDRGGAGKLKQVGAFEPAKKLKAECIVRQNSLKGEEKRFSDPNLKDFETTFEAGSSPKQVKNATSRKTFFRPSTHNYLTHQQQLIVPATFMWQALLPWQQAPAAVVANNSIKLAVLQQPLLSPVTTMPPGMFRGPFPTTAVSPPLVPQALQALQRLVDHQLDILNSIPGEVTPGMLHQRLTRSVQSAASVPLAFHAPAFVRHM